MELSSHEGEIPIPINSSYGGGHGHMIHHDPQTAASHNHNIIPTNSTNPQMPSINNNNGVPIPIPTPISSTTALELEDHQNHNIIVPFKREAVKYRECLKNHAAAMGGNATDGCGEFMPSGEEGTLEALTCSACNCHRNFHRKEVEGESNSSPCDNNYFHTTSRNISGRKVIVGHHHHKNVFGYPAAAAGTLITPRGAPPPPPQHHHMIMSYNMGSFASESDEQEDGGGGGVVLRPVPQQMVKKRFRTKFTQEQKEKMLDFAEKVGWKIQKQEEAVVQQFCQEIGVRRRVLKVWMHNNKHNLAKKNPSSSSNVQNPI